MLAADWQDVVTTLGTTVRDLRTLLQWSQQDLADYAVVSQGLISRLEHAKCAAIPLHSVVVVLRTLATGAAQLNVTLSPAVTHLLTFATNGPIRIADADPDLVILARALTTIPSRHRPHFMAILRAAATTFADDTATPAEES